MATAMIHLILRQGKRRTKGRSQLSRNAKVKMKKICAEIGKLVAFFTFEVNRLLAAFT